MNGVELPARVTVVCGASGSGKSAWTKQQIAPFARVCVYDADDEYRRHSFEAVHDLRALIKRLRESVQGRIAYVPRRTHDVEAFDTWARACFAWGNCAVVAEETADVTTPGKAPPGWGMLIRRGRKRNVRIYAVTQRPSESDKTVIGNATLLHVGALSRAQDRDYMARELDCSYEAIARLKPLEFVERDRASGELRQGIVVP